MKLRKSLVMLFILLLGVVLLTACDGTGEDGIKFTFEGIGDVSVEFDSEFNVLDGVKVMGSDGEDYTSRITFTTVSPNVDRETGDVNTKVPGEIKVRYEVIVDGSKAQPWRTITVLPPEREGDDLIQNGDFSSGVAYWDTYSVNAAIELIPEEDYLKIVMVSGNEPHEPRLTQMDVPFEKDKTYRISFFGKADQDKWINLQVGELLDNAPWFIDFKPKQQEIRMLTDEWQEFEYFFKHNLENDRGGVLFEFGPIAGKDRVDTTIYLKDVKAEEVEEQEDTTPPAFDGVANTMILLDSEFNPLQGVSAYDVGDGDVTRNITFEIFDSEGNVVEELDTSVEATYEIHYEVSDSKGNVATAIREIQVVGLIFKEENLFGNGDFKAPFVDEEGNITWSMWHQPEHWGEPAPIVDLVHNEEEGFVELDITGGGDASWAIQFTKPEEANEVLEYGKTYKVVITVKAEVERAFNYSVGYGDPYVKFGGVDGLIAKTEPTVHEYVFTNVNETHIVRHVLELGAMEGFADGKFTILAFELFELDEESILTNPTFDLLGWRGFHNDWDGSVVDYVVEDGEFKFVIHNLVGTGDGNNWIMQLIQDDISMGTGSNEFGLLELKPSTTYIFRFDAYASKEAIVNPNVVVKDVWVNYNVDGEVTVGTERKTYEVTVVTPEEVAGTEIFKFEFGNGFGGNVTDEWIVFADIMLVEVVDEEEVKVDSVYNGTFMEAIGWTLHSHNELNTMEVTEDGLLVKVESLGGEAYVPHLFQDGLTLAAGDYTLYVKVKGNVARHLRINVIETNNWGSLLPDSFVDLLLVEDEFMVLVVNFTLDAETSNVKVEVDFGPLGEELISEIGEFLFEEIYLFRRY